MASDGTTIASLIIFKGNFTSAKVPGKSFPSILSAIARICKVRVATSTSGSIAYIFAEYTLSDPETEKSIAEPDLTWEAYFSGIEKVIFNFPVFTSFATKTVGVI
ncbi:hypothetical protein D3C86_1793290 [compost metagenome]